VGVGRWTVRAVAWVAGVVTTIVVFVLCNALTLAAMVPLLLGHDRLSEDQTLYRIGIHGTLIVHRCEERPDDSPPWRCVGQFHSDDLHVTIPDAVVLLDERPGELVEAWTHASTNTDLSTDLILVPPAEWLLFPALLLFLVGATTATFVASQAGGWAIRRVRRPTPTPPAGLPSFPRNSAKS
jgi:hypothetical protein